MRVRKLQIFLSAALVLLLAGSASAAPKGARWGENYFPNVQVITQNGEALNFYDDLIRNKLVVINFIYTECPDICALSTARMAEVQRRLGDVIGQKIFMYSISIDPETDTPQKLKEFSQAFDAQPGWKFLTGQPDEIKLVRHKLGERSRSLSEHRNDVVLGNDVTGEWSRVSTMVNLDLLAQQILELDPEWRNRAHASSEHGTKPVRYRLGRRPGEALFLKACATCHTVGKGESVGPDLKGVTSKRDHGWLIRFLMNPDEMRARNDPIAVQLDTQYQGVSMPNLGLSVTDAKDLIAYLKLETLTVNAKAKLASGHSHKHGTQHKHKH